MPNFFMTHQWLRELRRHFRGGRVSFVGVYFRIPDDEIVAVGHYGRSHDMMSASMATAFLTKLDDPLGYEILISRTIPPTLIRSIRHLPQGIGWRYRPCAHGKPPCPCPRCLPSGSYKARKIREKFD